jgi:hypothetical protein
LKVITYEYTRIKRRNGDRMDNDEKRCFDSIVPVLALITCQALGTTLTSWQSLGSAWYGMQNHFKLGSRVSNDTYPKDLNHNQYGSGQGSYLATILWVLMSTCIYNMLDNIPVKVMLHHADGISAHERNVDGFVHDASLIMNEPVMDQDTHPLNMQLKVSHFSHKRQNEPCLCQEESSNYPNVSGTSSSGYGTAKTDLTWNQAKDAQS